MNRESGIGNRESRLRRLSIYDFRFAILALFLAGCAGEEKPRVGLDCASCHDYASLMAPRGNDAEGPREWLQSNSSGLLAVESPFTGQNEYTLEWPRRGRHPSFTLDSATCFTCHPVTSTGDQHSLAAYPRGVVENRGDCAPACHLWLPEQFQTQSHSRSAHAQTYTGSERPYALLTNDHTAHTTVFEKGYPAGADRSPRVKIQFVSPGCVGCHSLQDSRHGTIATCTDCHNFVPTNVSEAAANKGLHEFHLLVINSARAPDAQPPNCSYCHNFTTPAGGDSTLAAGACYNCHLSGHNPTTALWR